MVDLLTENVDEAAAKTYDLKCILDAKDSSENDFVRIHLPLKKNKKKTNFGNLTGIFCYLFAFRMTLLQNQMRYFLQVWCQNILVLILVPVLI